MGVGFSFPTVSIIVLNYNGKQFLDDCFDSFAKIDYPKDRLEVILVDNCSSDNSVEYTKSKNSWVRLVSLKSNYGFTGGNNAGVEFAKGDFIVFVNNDVVVDKYWLIELVKVAMNNPTALVTSKSLFLDKPDIVDHAGTKATFIGRSFSIDFGRRNDNSDSVPKYVIQPYGASMLVKKTVFEDLGKFDETYFTSLEDTDLGFKAWTYGYKVIYVPTSIFYHVGGGTGGWGSRISNIMVFHLTKNSYMNILKYFNFIRAFQGVILSLFYYAISSIWSIKEGRADTIKPVLQAHLWVIRNLGSIFEKRNVIARNRHVTYSFLFKSSFFATLPEMLKENSIIQEFYETYYVKGK